MDYTLEKKLQGFQLIAQEKLQSTLWSIPHKKDLIIEPGIIKILEHVCVASWIKSKGIQSIFKFDAEIAIPRKGNTQVFLISSSLSMFKKVLNQIHEHERKLPTDIESGLCNFHIILVPNCSIFFQNILEEEGLHSIVQLHRFNWDFIFLDTGVISMELPQVFKEIFIRHDISLLPPIAHSLRVLNMMAGKPDLILTYGEKSSKLLQMMNILGTTPHVKTNITSQSSQSGDFSAMIIIDRDKDYISSLLTPSIYSGLLLEVFKYRAGEVEIALNETKISSQKLELFKIKKTKTNSNKTKTYSSVIRLNSKKDNIYGENRYKHFSDASNLVRAQAKAIGDEVEKLNKMNVNEMQLYVTTQLPQISEKKTKILKHLYVCEKIVEELSSNIQTLFGLEQDILNNTNRKKILTEIDNILTTDGQKFNTIRLMCLVHLSMGLSSHELSTFIRNYCNYFGHQYLDVFNYLAKAGLLPFLEEEKLGKSKLLANLTMPKFQQTEFQANANRLKLLVSSNENESQSDKDDSTLVCPSYVFNGIYIPLAVQIACILLKTRNFEELVQKLGAIDNIELQTSEMSSPEILKQILSPVNRGEIRNIFPIKKRTIFIFVVGGVTYAEIAACEFIGRLTASQIVVGSDNIIAGSDIIAAAF